MDLRFHTGRFILAIKDEYVVKANRIDVVPGGYILDEGDLSIAANDLTHSWQISPTQPLPIVSLDERTRIGGAILDMELSISRFQAETKRSPFVLANAPVIFGAASLALTVLGDRTSDDVDFALDADFLRWRRDYWPSLGITQAETVPFGVFAYCGNWRSRATLLEGLEGNTFRLMHPIDTVMQKLLRIKSADGKFEHKDKGDIIRIMSTLAPSRELISEMLTENSLRYQEPVIEPGHRGRAALAQFSSTKENTEWFLDQFLPNVTYDEIRERALQKHEQPIDVLEARSASKESTRISTIIEARRCKL